MSGTKVKISKRESKAIHRYASRNPDAKLALITDPSWDRPEGGGYGLTLVVRGVIICGRVVSASQYFHGLKKYVDAMRADGREDEALQEFAEDADTESAEYRELWKSPEESLTKDQLVSRWSFAGFIHLRDAYVFDPGSGNRTPVGFYRVRSQSVDAWTLGTITRG